jgi:hypothetical protein
MKYISVVFLLMLFFCIGCMSSKMIIRPYKKSDFLGNILKDKTESYLITQKDTFYLSMTKSLEGAFGPYWFEKRNDTLYLHTIVKIKDEIQKKRTPQYVLHSSDKVYSTDLFSTHYGKDWFFPFMSKYLKDTVINKHSCYVFEEFNINGTEGNQSQYRKIYIEHQRYMPIRIEWDNKIIETIE